MSPDAERLAKAGEVLAGEERRRSHNGVYAGYVAVIAAGAYGVPAAQALLRFVDPQWLAAHLGGVRGPLLGVGMLAAAGGWRQGLRPDALGFTSTRRTAPPGC